MDNKYNDIKELFLSKECSLITKYEDFINYTVINYKSKYKILSKCGHESIVMLTSFKQHGTGILCKNCIKEKCIKNNANKEHNYHINEAFGINILKKYINNDILEIVLLEEGTHADIAIKPKNIINDLYLTIQIKTTEKKRDNKSYSFTLHNKNYNNMLVMLICLQEEKFWIIDNYSDLKKKYYSIYIYEKSKFNKYFIADNNNLNDILINFYNIKNYNLSLNKIDIPLRESKQKEIFYKKIREEKLSFINFTDNEIQQQSYDFKINNKYKVQEKVAIQLKNRNKNGIRVNLQKSTRTKKKNPYYFGENDYYVFHIQDKEHFYWVPQKVLYEQKYLTDTENNIEGKVCIILYPYGSKRNVKSNWINEYLFNYNNLDIFKEKFPELLIKENIIIKDNNFERLEALQNEYNSKEKKEEKLINTYKIVPTKEELIELIINKGMSQQKIADRYNVSRSVIRRLIKNYDVKR